MLKRVFNGNKTSLNVLQHYATSCSMAAKQLQHVGLNNVASTSCIRLARKKVNKKGKVFLLKQKERSSPGLREAPSTASKLSYLSLI